MALPSRIPFADLVDIDTSYDEPLTRLDAIVFHIAVSNSDRPSYKAGTKAHGYIRRDGFLVQDVSLRMRGGATKAGNVRVWAFETEGGLDLDDRNAGKWSEAQLATIVRLVLLAAAHGVPLRLMESSRSTERGIGWHRLGIDGNFPALPSLLAGRGQRGGGEVWSSARGKECPYDGRILQFPEVLDRALGRTPNQSEEDDMNDNQDAALAQTMADTARIKQIVEGLEQYIADPNGRGRQADDVVLGVLPRGASVPGRETRLVDGVDLAYVRDQIKGHVDGQLAGLTTAIVQLASGRPVDLAAITEAARAGAAAGIAESLEGIETTAVITLGSKA